MSEIRKLLGLDGTGCVVIAEVAQAHDGSLGMAHAHIDAARKAGADIVKFQTHIASAESTRSEPWRVKFSPQDETRYDYWERMEFTETQWAGLKRHAVDVGLGFISTPFSPQAVDLLLRVGVSGWKVASGEVTNLPLIRKMVKTGMPIMLSSGMSRMTELDAAASVVQEAGVPLAVFQCTSAYPTPASQVGLNLIGELEKRFGVPVGLSDHSAQVATGVAAVALGAALLEVHLTLSGYMFGPDVPASLSVDELRQLVNGVRFVEECLANPVDKDEIAESIGGIRSTFQKSLVAARDIEAGESITFELLELKKPGDGLTADQIDLVIGQVAVEPIERDAQLRLDALQPAR